VKYKRIKDTIFSLEKNFFNARVFVWLKGWEGVQVKKVGNKKISKYANSFNSGPRSLEGKPACGKEA
jgi:lantibiotic modifying enzyme